MSTPAETGVQLIKTNKDMSINPRVLYKETIGSLMYMATATQPDIMFAVLALAQFAQDPAKMHWEAAKRVIRYLKGMRDLELTYGAASTGIVGYTDADHASQYHCHSILGYTFLINGGTVSWSSKKKSIVALSMTEVEYMAATHATK